MQANGRANSVCWNSTRCRYAFASRLAVGYLLAQFGGKHLIRLYRLPSPARQMRIQIEAYVILTEAHHMVLFLTLGIAMERPIVQTEYHLERVGPDENLPLPGRDHMRWRGTSIGDKDAGQLWRCSSHLLNVHDETGENIIKLTRTQVDMGLRAGYLEDQIRVTPEIPTDNRTAGQHW